MPSGVGNVVFLGIGAVLVVVSLCLAYMYSRVKKILDELWAVDTYSASELARMVKGDFNATVEVEGEISCPEPVYGPATGIRCCWVNTTVAREDRRTRQVTERDSDGRTHTRTETYYEWVTDYNRTQTTLFRVQDSTGYSLVDPTDAEIETSIIRSETTYNREDWFGNEVGYSDTGKYRIVEAALVPEGYAFVLGQATQHPEGVLVKKPEKGYMDPKSRFFFISRKNEAQLASSNMKARNLYFWFGLIAFIAGAGCIIAYIGAM